MSKAQLEVSIRISHGSRLFEGKSQVSGGKEVAQECFLEQFGFFLVLANTLTHI